MSELQAGRQLDELIASQVMGEPCIHDLEFIPRDVIVARNRAEWLDQWGQEAPPGWEGHVESEWSDYQAAWCKHCHRESGGRLGVMSIPRYSRDLLAAWAVVEKMDLFASRYALGNDAGLCLERGRSGEWQVRYREGITIARGDTVPLAICRAALYALQLVADGIIPPTASASHAEYVVTKV